MKFLVTNEAESNAVLTYFGSFHDAFIQTLALHTHYERTSAGENLFPGFDIAVVFSHSGYAPYDPPTRIVRAEFLNASHLHLELEAIESGEFFINRARIGRSPDEKFEFAVDFEDFGATKLKWDPVFRFEKAIFSEE